ncbi:EHD1 [Scenedesmus sp. PABB004]|nr:EHD1 [Scenedesmus sp. PABB004]
MADANAAIYDRWFKVADADQDGRVTGADAVAFFQRSGLPKEVLAKVWDLANSQRAGYLDRPAFHKAMGLIALAQSGKDVTRDNYLAALEEGVALPTMAGLDLRPSGATAAAAVAAERVPAGPCAAAASQRGRQLPEPGPARAPAARARRRRHAPPGAPEPGAGAPAAAPGPARDAASNGGYASPRARVRAARARAALARALPAPRHARAARRRAPAPQPPQQEAATPPRGKGGKKPLPAKVVTSIIDGLKAIYFSKVRPLEDAFKFGSFFSPLLTESDFEAKPSVLLLGQYSTGARGRGRGGRVARPPALPASPVSPARRGPPPAGHRRRCSRRVAPGKTTFIKFLLGTDYPGCHIGPEPTTDRFVVVQHGLEERRTPGNTLAVQPDKPYQGLSMFGTGFLSRFEGASCPAKLLEEITIIDTPGVLSGEKQRIERNYQFIDVCEWFAVRSDLILLLFDPYKLDISDEFKQVISTLKGHDDKVRIILNKSDQVDQQQLMRVYGALMWSLGKVFKSPEVCKVYIGSFNADAPIDATKNPHCVDLFGKEQAQLLHDLYEIPTRSCDRKINEFVKRVRAFRIHLLIMGHMRAHMPAMFGKDKAARKMLEHLPDIFYQVQREHHLPAGDFPDVHRFRDILSAFDLSAFPKMSKSMVKQIDDVLSIDVPNLVRAFDNPYQ